MCIIEVNTIELSWIEVQAEACYIFDLSRCYYIVEIPLAWEIAKMTKRLEKTVLRFNYARYELRHNTSRSGNGG